jgi:phosphatidylethanolamine/phosphatidyl-N-methylethanolamine N-methyltransferase
MHIVTFSRQLLQRPGQIGAIAPSSRKLCALMAAQLPMTEGPVVELGPGTGRITEALLERGVAPQDLHLVEINRSFADLLRKRFPGVNVHHAGAQDLAALGIANVRAVVSGLPLLSMSLQLQRDILAAAFTALRPDGVMIQFTYGFRPPIRRQIRHELGLQWQASRTIVANLPPARVYVFRRSQKD